MRNKKLKNKIFALLAAVVLVFSSISGITEIKAEESTTSTSSLNTSSTLPVVIAENATSSLLSTSNATTSENVFSTTTQNIPSANSSSSNILTSSQNSVESTTTLPIPLNPNTSIDSGNSNADANLLNLLNANVLNSTGTFSVVNSFEELNKDIVANLMQADSLSSSSIGSSDLKVNFENGAKLSNDVNVNATSGANLIVNPTGTSTIDSGNANAVANVINFANTNIVDSKYVFLVTNSMNDWNGDLVLPGKDFFANLFQNSSSNICQAVNVDNSADITNNATTDANSGGNNIDGSGNITTGNTVSNSNVENVANVNSINSDYVFVLVKVMGSWQGQVYSLPPGISITQTPEGILISNSAPSHCLGNPNSISSKNDATIENNVHVSANTGDNAILGNASGTSFIKTGDAAALSNIINVANTNILSSNWLYALVNILGAWKGDIAFGRPDIWLGERAIVSENPLISGSTVTLNIDLANYGDADATDVNVETSFSDPSLAQIFDKGNAQPTDKGLKWNIGTLPAGATTTLSYKFSIPTGINGLRGLNIFSSAKEFEKDGNMKDNSENFGLTIAGNILGWINNTGNGNPILPAPQLSIVKNSSTTGEIHPGDSAAYIITVKNTGVEPIANAIVLDILKDPTGKVIATNYWPLDKVAGGEEVRINYDNIFASTAPIGKYTSLSILKAFTPGGLMYQDISTSYATNLVAKEESTSLDALDEMMDRLSNSNNVILSDLSNSNYDNINNIYTTSSKKEVSSSTAGIIDDNQNLQANLLNTKLSDSLRDNLLWLLMSIALINIITNRKRIKKKVVRKINYYK